MSDHFVKLLLIRSHFCVYFWYLLSLLIDFFPLDSLDQKNGGISSVIDDLTRPTAIRPGERIHGQLPVLLQSLSLPGKDLRSARLGHRGRGLVLGGVDVAGTPSDIGAQFGQSLDQNCSLDGHMEGTTDSGTLKDLNITAKLLAAVHEAGHLSFSKLDFLVSKVSEVNVLDQVFVSLNHL